MGGWKPIDHGAFIGETHIFSCLFLIRENAYAKIQQHILNFKVFPFIKKSQNILMEKSRRMAPPILKSYWKINIKYGQQWLRFTHMSTQLSFPLRLNLLRQLHLPLVPLVAWQTELCKVLKKVWQSITDFSLLPIQKTVCVCVCQDPLNADNCFASVALLLWLLVLFFMIT